MRYFTTAVRTALGQRLCSVKGWLVLLLLPGLIFGVKTWIPAEESAAPVQVGVCLPEEGAEAFWELLQNRSGTVLEFVLSDEETIDRNVAAGKWDCGLILPEDFQMRIEELDTDRLITVRIGSGSTVYPLVQETVSACMAYLLSGPIAEEYLCDAGMALTEEGEAILHSYLDEPMAAAECVEVSMRTVDGRALDSLTLADSGTDGLLRWLTAAVLLVWMLLCAADLGKWFTSPGVRRLYPLRSATCLLAAKVSADVIIGLAAGSAAMLVLGDGLKGVLAVAAYVCFWGGAAVLMARFPAVWAALPALPPFAVVLSLLFSGLLVDMGTIVPALDRAADFAPSAVFLGICGGEYTGAVAAAGMTVMCLTASLLIDKIRNKR